MVISDDFSFAGDKTGAEEICAHFGAAAERLAAQFDAYEPLPGHCRTSGRVVFLKDLDRDLAVWFGFN